jgi:hypothetical protein
MSQVSANLQAVLEACDCEIERIEFELTASGFCWHLWARGERIFSADSEADPHQLAGALEATKVLASMVLGISEPRPSHPSLN